MMLTEVATTVTPGLCACGCGRATSVVLKTDRAKGYVAGDPRRFVAGHHRKLAAKQRFVWTVEDRGFETPCWTWGGYRNNHGYGQTGVRGKKEGAHVAVYEQMVGEIPAGLDLDHLCRHRDCVNPEHLEPVTRAVNARRGARAKITAEAAADIHERSALAAELIALIAAEYEIATRTVLDIGLGRRWAQAVGHSRNQGDA